MSVQSLVRSTILLGSSSAVNTLIAILRVKALALMVGPAGLGLLGTLAGMATVGTTAFAMGADTSATRRLAIGRDSPAAVARLRRTLLALTIVHGLGAVLLFWTCRVPLSRWLLGSEAYAFEVGLLGFAVAFSLMAGLRIAVLQGLGQVGAIARVGVLSSVAATVIGLAAVWQFGLAGLIVLMLVQPLVAALLARAFAPPLPGAATEPGSANGRLGAEWTSLLVEGAPFMVSAMTLALTPLAVRALIIREGGLEAAGHFHAAWTMSVIYVGFLLNAMSADFFPRLTGLVGDRKRACDLICDQAQVGLAFGGPALLVMLAAAPWIVPLLYSQAFAPAAAVIEWQALGNLMKIAAWPVAFLAMARGRSGLFLALELAWTCLFLALVWLGLPHLGLEATGIAFMVGCAAYLALQTIAAWSTFGFRWRRDALLLLGAYVGAAILTLVAARHSSVLQAVTGISFAAVLGLVSLRRILTAIGGGGRIGQLAHRIFARLGWPLGPAGLAKQS